MPTPNLSGPPAHRPDAAWPRLSTKDRLLSWFYTGPLGRGVAFVLDLGALAWRTLLRRDPDRRGR